MSEHPLVLEPLAAEAFAPFGAVVAFDPANARRVNGDTASRSDSAAAIDHAPGTVPVLAIYRADGQSLPLRLGLVERHPHSTQTFVSLGVARFLVVVVPSGPNGLPLAHGARAFVGTAGMGVNYRRDQWHTPILALDAGGDFLMLMGQGGLSADCVEHRLSHPLTISS